MLNSVKLLKSATKYKKNIPSALQKVHIRIIFYQSFITRVEHALSSDID